MFSHTPNYWESNRARGVGLKPNEILQGYLDGFDPDIVVPVGKATEFSLAVGHRDNVSVDEVLGNITESAAPRGGIGLFELLWDLLEKEFKYQRTDKLQLVFPRLPESFRPFFASVFGALSPEIEAMAKKQIPETVLVDSPEVSLENYAALLEPHLMFPRRLSYWSLEERPLHSPTLFLCDAGNGLDIIDYWNLRAAGHNVLPIPKQAADNEVVKSLARRFIEDNSQPYRNNPEIYHRTTIQKSRTISEEEAKSFCDSLQVGDAVEPQWLKFALRLWYPRLWDRWARDQAHEAVHFAYSHDVEIPIDDSRKRLDLRSQDPHVSFSRLGYSGAPKFANELRFSFYGSKEPMAEIVPEGGKRLSAAIGGIGYDNWRFSSSGPVFLAHHEKDLLFVDLPTAESVITEWLRERGWQVALSTPGRMALQLYRQLGGSFGITWLAHRGVIPLLRDLEKEAGLPWPTVMSRLQAIIQAEGLHFEKERFLEGLIESNALRLGASIQCSVCTRHNWYELDKLRYELQCKFCLSNFAPPVESPRDIDWTYRAHGPFAGSAPQGAFSVLLTLRFLAGRNTNGGVTPLFSYVASKDGVTLESDLTCLYKSNRGDSRTHVIHAECKSFGGFEVRDFERMTQLAREFPGAALIFATLMDRLDAFSSKKLVTLALQQRKLRLARKPYSPIIVLTGGELFSMRGAPECWRLTPLYEDISRAVFHEPLLDVWADATQRLHLTMPAWHQWREEQWQKHRKGNAPRAA